jgi:hypothetical protein
MDEKLDAIYNMLEK